MRSRRDLFKSGLKLTGIAGLGAPIYRTLAFGAPGSSKDLSIGIKTPAQGLRIGGLTLNAATGVPEFVAKDALQKHFVVWDGQSADTTDGLPNVVEVPFAPHSIISHPFKTEMVLAFPNNPLIGDVMEVDIRNRRLSSRVRSKNGRGFYGHGIFDKARSALYTVEYDAEQKTSVIVRDPLTYQILSQFDSYGSHPHDLGFTPAGDLLICCHNIATIVDPKSGKLVTKYEISDETQILAHVQFDSLGAFILAGTMAKGPDDPLAGKIFRIKQGEASLSQMTYLNPPKGQALSSALDASTDLMLVTHPEAGQVLYWNVKTGAQLGSLDFKNTPRGVQFDRVAGTFIVTTVQAEIYICRMQESRMVVQIDPSGRFSNSAHFSIF